MALRKPLNRGSASQGTIRRRTEHGDQEARGLQGDYRFDLPRTLPIRGEERFAEEGLLELQCVDVALDAAVVIGALHEGLERPSQARAAQVELRPFRHHRNARAG